MTPTSWPRIPRSTLPQEQSRDCRRLTGNYKREHLFTLGQALAAYDFFSEQIAACDVEIAAMYQTVTPSVMRTAPPLPPPSDPAPSGNMNRPSTCAVNCITWRVSI